MNDLITVSADLKEIECRIKLLKGKTAEIMLAIGDELVKAKSLLNHGEWTAWLENNVELSDRTARQLMQAAQAFPIEKRRTLADLDISKVYLLAGAPEDQQVALLESGAAASMTTRELKSKITHSYQQREVVTIELKKLKRMPDPLYTYPTLQEIGYPKIIGMGSVDFYALCSDMEKYGQRQAISITEDGTVIDGYMRIQAAYLLKWKTLEARVEPIKASKDESFEYKCLEFYYKWNMLTHTRWAAFDLYHALLQLHCGDYEDGEALLDKYLQSNKDEETQRYLDMIGNKIGV